MKRPSKLATCTACGESFLSRKSPQGRWAKTCSLECQIEKLDDMIAALTERRDRLADEAGIDG